MKAVLVASERVGKRLRFYLPDRYVPSIGYINPMLWEMLEQDGYECLVYLERCSRCVVEPLHPASWFDGNPHESRMVVEELF